MKFNLCILDGPIVSGGHPAKLGLIMANQDPVAIDTYSRDSKKVYVLEQILD